MKNKICPLLFLLFVSLSFLYAQNVSNKQAMREWQPTKFITQVNETFTYSLPSFGDMMLAYSGGSTINSHPFRNIFYNEVKNDVVSPKANISATMYDCRNPSIISDNDGVTHLVWGIRTDSLNRDWVDTPLEIYYSYFKNSSWSAPVSIYHLDMDVNNNAFVSGKLYADKNNTLYLLFFSKEASVNKLNLLIKRNSIWEPAVPFMWPFANNPVVNLDYSNYYDFKVDKYGRIHLVFNSYINSVTAIYYSCSDDYGKTWSTPVQVQKTAQINTTSNYKINIDGNGIIHVLSITDNKDIYHTYSSDGKIWSQSKSIINYAKGFFIYFDFLIDGLNVIHLLMSSNVINGYMTGQFPKTLYMSCYNNTWSNPDTLSINLTYPFYLRVDSKNYLNLCSREYNNNIVYTSTKSPLFVGVEEKHKTIVNEYNLEQNYPNPFNPTTIINYSVGSDCNSPVTVKIYDIMGRAVSVLVNEFKNPGRYSVEWRPEKLAGGVYYCQLTAGKFREVRKMVFIK
jgi:hypothetical protein